ncbi:MAG: DNA gyrase subunit B, partial [Thermoanaerobaculia bacterium]
GYLYIAQPPLFKIAEGKKETYLKDERELSKFLLARLGGDDRTLTQARSKQQVAGAKLIGLLEKMDGYRAHVTNLEARGVPEEFLRAWLDSDLFRAEDFKDRRKLDGLAAEAKKLEFSRAEVVADEEKESFVLELSRSVNGIDKSFRLDPEFASSHEAKRLRECARALGTFLVGPYEIRHGDEKQTCETLVETLESIYESAKKGLAIQRYKGLGEMNPQQLWETTMDREKRHLLQVNVEDAVEADEIFSVLMGDEVEPRRLFIETNALAAKNLDI